jgi:hypothetical protein
LHLEALYAVRCAQAAAIPPVTVVPAAARAAPRRVSPLALLPGCSCVSLLVLLVNDSKYIDLTSQKPIQWHGCIYLVSLARCAQAWKNPILGPKAPDRGSPSLAPAAALFRSKKKREKEKEKRKQL